MGGGGGGGGGWWVVVVVGGNTFKKKCVYQYAIASSRAVLSQSWQAELFYHNPGKLSCFITTLTLLELTIELVVLGRDTQKY